MEDDYSQFARPFFQKNGLLLIPPNKRTKETPRQYFNWRGAEVVPTSALIRWEVDYPYDDILVKFRLVFSNRQTAFFAYFRRVTILALLLLMPR